MRNIMTIPTEMNPLLESCELRRLLQHGYPLVEYYLNPAKD